MVTEEGSQTSQREKIGRVRDEVLEGLRTIIDPDLGRDLVSLNFIKELFISDSGDVRFTIQLTTMACPVQDDFVKQAEVILGKIEGVASVTVDLTAQDPNAAKEYLGHENAAENLRNVSHILAVSSGKGGVGKSSIAVNLAYTLANRGARVGLVDCDVYGPSLGVMLDMESAQVYFKSDCDDETVTNTERLQKMKGRIQPIECRGVKVLSYAFMRNKSYDYAAIRGPLASSLVYQMVTQTEWGQLDYLLLDLPPGTGDIHLTIAQSVPVSGSIVVTTPSPLSVVDVNKGIRMFSAVKIPSLAIIENMATKCCHNCGEEENLWGKENDRVKNIATEFGIKILVKLPLDVEFSLMKKQIDGRDQRPYVNFASDDQIIKQRFTILADEIVMELARQRYSDDRIPDLQQTESGSFTLSYRNSGGTSVFSVPGRELRLSCRCALCVDEFSGRKKLNPKTISSKIFATGIKMTGNYAATIIWDGGHESIISFDLLKVVALEYENSPQGKSSSGCAATDMLNF